MIDFIKHYFSTPYVELTPQDKWGMMTIAIGFIFVVALIVFGVSWLIDYIRRRK